MNHVIDRVYSNLVSVSTNTIHIETDESFNTVKLHSNISADIRMYIKEL